MMHTRYAAWLIGILTTRSKPAGELSGRSTPVLTNARYEASDSKGRTADAAREISNIIWDKPTQTNTAAPNDTIAASGRSSAPCSSAKETHAPP